MNSLEKRQPNRRGSAHGPRKYSDGISETSSVGSFLDDTDREVSSLTDRAFRSLCIGEDAIYNDLEVSSPANQHKEVLQKKDSRTTCQESSLHDNQYDEAERKSEVDSTFQHSYVDEAQEHFLRDESLAYIRNGSLEATWQQKRNTSRVSSLIKSFSSGESYCDSGTPDAVKDKYQDFNNESWDKSTLLSIQKELSNFSSVYQSDFKSGNLPLYGNHIHALTRMNTATCLKTKFKAQNTTNLFFHSELSPFQLWRDYNRFPFEREEPSGFVSATEFPRWYDSPLYKELTATHRISSSPTEVRQFTRRKIENVVASQRSRSTIIQKASAIEKRCESETASNCPPWKNTNFVRNKLPSNRPSTVSPTNEKGHRPDSSLLYHRRDTYENQHKAGKVSSGETSSRTTPFNITQLLTPVIPGRQETETSEILQFAHTPLVSECDSDLKMQSDVKQLRDSYKSKASSLLFNLKDNRKRVKSTYSPTIFKSSEISDRNKQPSKLEGRESRLSEASGTKVFNQEHSTAHNANPVQPNYELSLFQTAEHEQYADRLLNNLNLVSPYGAKNCNIDYQGSQNNHPDLFTNRESEHYELSENSEFGNTVGNPVGHINDSSGTFGPTRPETEYIFSKAQVQGHASAETAAKQTDLQDFNEGKNFVGKQSSEYINNQVTEDNLSWKRTGHVNMVTQEMVDNNEIINALPYKGEIAALIEMDKQRKVTAKQCLPSAIESYTSRNETCINKMNQNVDWFSKDKPSQGTKSSLQTYAEKRFSNKPVKDYHTNPPATSQNSYEFHHNDQQKMAAPPKDGNATKSSEITAHDKAEVCFQRNMIHATSDVETENNYDQRTQFLRSMEEKYHNNEGSVAYQPYKYESNKQWHIATTENRPTKGEECMSRQLQQSEIKAEQPGELNYAHSLSRTSSIQQQSTAYSARTSQRNVITEDRAKTQEHKPTYSIASSQIYHKQGDMNTDKPNTLQNNSNSQTRGDRFNINDILSVRDNEQAKRVKENKHSFNGRVGDPTKLEDLTSLVTSYEAEDIVAKAESYKVQSLAQQDGNSLCKHTNVSYGYVRKESRIPNDVKERSGKDMFISNENDKISARALSFKEKGQTKQEILTSKLKAHAQKEISAIKEKGLAKHAIPSRNPIKQSTAVNNEKLQDVLSPKKEITAEKLNHLFQDITYSSVPPYKEQRNQRKDEPKYESLPAEKVELSRDMGSDQDKVATEREKTQMLSETNCEVQKSKENQLRKSSKDKEKEQLTDDYTAENEIPDKCLSSPTLKVFSDKEFVVKKEDKTTCNLPTPCISNYTDYSTFKENENDRPKHEVLVKAVTNHLTLYNISGSAITLENSTNKAKEQLSNVNTEKSTTDSHKASLKCYDLAETTKSEDNTRNGNSLTLLNTTQLKINTRQHTTSLDWTKDEVPAVKDTVEFIDTRTAFKDKQMANTEQEIKHLQNGAGGISENQTVLSESLPKSNNQVQHKPNTELTKNEVLLEKQDNQTDAVQTPKANEDSDIFKSPQNAYATKELEYQTAICSNKAVNTTLAELKENKYSLHQEPDIKNLYTDNHDVQETVSQLKLKIENQHQQVTENNNQPIQGHSYRVSDNKHNSQNAKDFHELIETTPTEKEQSNNDIRTCSINESQSPVTRHEKSEEELSMPINTINNKDQQLSSHTALNKSADITNPAPESHVIHIASKEDSSPTDEPVIYNICVSSTSEAVSEDEPIIFSISVSSLSDSSKTTVLENQTVESRQKQPSIGQREKDDKETFANKNKESDLLESKEKSKEVKLCLNDSAEQETVVRKYNFPASKDKLDYYRSTEVDNISSSYEKLLAKYGLSNGNTIHIDSDQERQNKKQGDEKEESTHDCLQKIQNNKMGNDHAPVEKMLTSADFTEKRSPESRKLESPQAFSKRIREAGQNHEQCVTHTVQDHQTDNGGCTQIADRVVYSDRNIKQDVSAKEEIPMSNVVAVCDDIVDTQPAKQIMAKGNVQLKENQQVRQKVQTMHKVLKVNDDYILSKNTEVVQEKCENNTQLTAGFRSANSNKKSLNHSFVDLPQPNSKVSTNDYHIRNKTQDTEVSSVQNTVIETRNTKIPKLQYRTQEDRERYALKQEKATKEFHHTEDNKTLQNNRTKLICKSEFPEFEQVKFMRRNEAKVSKVIVSQKEISPFTNKQIKDNQNLLKYAVPDGKTDQSVFTHVALEDKEMNKNGIKNQIKAEPVSETAQHTTPAKVTETKVLSAPGMTENDLERLEKEKCKRQTAQKERKILKDEITPIINDPKRTSSSPSAIKNDKDADCESRKKNLKEAKAQPQDIKKDHFEKLITDDTRKNTGQKEIKVGVEPLTESSDLMRWDTGSSEKVLGEALLERTTSTFNEKTMFESIQNSNNQDTVFTEKDGNSSKTEVTQREKKTTRPEISALADYARLRVISAEDDTVTEKDLLQKMNTHQKYNLSSVEPQEGKFSVSVGEKEQSKQLCVNRKCENLNATAAPFQGQERETCKVTDEVCARHSQCLPRGEIIAHPKLESLAKSPDNRVFDVKDIENTKEKKLTAHMPSNTNQPLTAQDHGYSRSHEVHQPQSPGATHPELSQTDSKNDPKLKQPVDANMLQMKVYSQGKKAQSKPQVSVETKLNDANQHADNQITEELKDEETTEELQYYIVSAMETKSKLKNTYEALSLSHKNALKKDLTEIHATAPRSNTSSPATGKPIMFKVKDNTGKTSSVTKTVRPRFHRSFSEDFRIGSPLESCIGSEKGKVENEMNPKESANPPVAQPLHEQLATSHRLPRATEVQARNKRLSPGFIAAKEPINYNRKGHMIEENESRSIISTVSEDVESLAASSVVMTDSRGFDTEHIGHTYARPESSCYERPESVCYERPESACSDLRPASKPPAVPAKTEKALRRAKRLTNRRIKKVDDMLTSDSPEAKSIRTVSSLPASPMMQMSTPRSIQASPPISHYHAEPNYAPSAPSIVTHSFPVTQRKLLQDPNSGQIFMVDMPVQVKKKTFFDPETGKYLQLNVRQRSQSTLSQPASMEVLGHPYMVYPGFLPVSVSVSSLPSVRSSSQMSAPATLTKEPNQQKARREPSEQGILEPEHHRTIQHHNRPVYRTCEQTGRGIVHTENVRMTPRQTHIITMSELEDFAVENT